MNAYFDRSQAITLELLRALAIAMDVPDDTFVGLCQGHASELRLNHYPPIAVQTLEQGTTSRIWPHTDFGIITLLADSKSRIERTRASSCQWTGRMSQSLW
jgi:isopenicillin N synthase-like dioxygenase